MLARRSVACTLLVVFLLVGQARSVDNPRLNVLLIAFDDLRPELGCYGNKLIDTPNFDALAKSGVRFERAYCQFPLCNPSRTSLLTGRQPNTTGVVDNRTYFREAHPDFVTLPQHFKANGYVTARTGKIFHGGIDDTDAWTIGGEPRVDQKTRPGQDPMQSDRIVKLEGDGASHGDYKSATRAIQLLEQLKDKPYFLAVGFAKPHSPPTAPAKLFDLYDVAKMPLPPILRRDPRSHLDFPSRLCPFAAATFSLVATPRLTQPGKSFALITLRRPSSIDSSVASWTPSIGSNFAKRLSSSSSVTTAITSATKASGPSTIPYSTSLATCQ